MTSPAHRMLARCAWRLGPLLVAGALASAASAQDAGASLARLTRQAEGGDAAAQYELARHYDGQTGQAFDRARSLDFLQRATQHGHVRAQVDLAFRFLNGSEINPPDPARSFQWFSRAATGGSTIARCMLGDFHRDGRGGAPRSDRKAFELYRLTAASSDACARKSQYELHRMYEEGRGTARNPAIARVWLKKSAQAGNPIAQAALGRAHLEGRGVARDEAQGRFWLRQSRKGVAPHDDDDHDDHEAHDDPARPGASGGGHRHP